MSITDWMNFINNFKSINNDRQLPQADTIEVTLANGMKITLRQEEGMDYCEVELLTRRAFWKTDRLEKLGGIGADEHYLAYTLRSSPEFVPELDYVAEYNGKIIANVMYSMAYVQMPDGKRHAVLNFGPLSVLPEYQKIGVGGAIMCHTIKLAKEFGYGAILFFGHPTYYPRLGFCEAKSFGITTAKGDNYPAFMAMELIPGDLDGVTGAFHESPLFEVDAAGAREYERLFPEIKREPNMKKLTEEHLPFLHRLMNIPEIIAVLHGKNTTLSVWQDAYTEWLKDNDEQNFIIYSADKPAGWLKLNGLNNTAAAWISMLVILPEYQHRGIGSYAVNFSVDYIKKRGFKRACIHTNRDNKAAQACYSKCGFLITETGDCTNADGQQRIGYTFEKNLDLEETEKIKLHWFADLYDQKETQTEDFELLLSLIGDEPKKVFEVCCGSGRILIPLAKSGHFVVGLDINDEMIARIPAKANGLNNLRYYKADAIKADWGQNYDVAVLAGNIMINIESDMDYKASQRLFIKKASDCLKPGGHLFLDFNLFMHPEKIFGASKERVIFEGIDDRGIYGKSTIFGESYDIETQITHFVRRFDFTLPDGTHKTVFGTGRKYIPTLAEVHSWLAEYGFCTESEYGDYNKNPISESTYRAVIWARKIEK